MKTSCPKFLENPEDKGNKIPYKNMNILDKVLMKNIVPPISKTLYNLNVTPNIVTISGFLIRLYSFYLFNNKKCWESASLWGIGYILDCVDGHMARKYDQETILGDFLDHGSDIITMLILVYFMWKMAKGKYKYLFIILILFILITCISLTLQEQYTFCNNTQSNNKAMITIPYNFPKKNLENIPLWADIFGCGSNQLYVCIMMYIICKYS